MRKLVLVAAMFMFVCGGSFLVKAQDPVKTQNQTEQKSSKDSTGTKTDSTSQETAGKDTTAVK